MSDYHDYNEFLVFPPQGDQSDTEPHNNTDRTQSSIELVGKIKELTDENTKVKKLLSEVRIYVYIATQYYDGQPVVDPVALKLLGEIDRLLGDN